MKNLPVIRRHLGDFEFSYRDRHSVRQTVTVSVHVAPDMLAKQLGLKAVSNKSKRSKLAGGAVLVVAS